MKIRTIVVDDEPLARERLLKLRRAEPDIDLVGEAKNGREAVALIREAKPALAFLDVQMPELDGFGALAELAENERPAVIFVTAYDEFAVRAFEAHALDYLVKPLEEARFTQALDRVREHLRSLNSISLSRKLAAMLAAREVGQARERIVVVTSNGKLILNADEVDWIEADDYYAAIHARNGRHLVRESLTSLEQRLNRKMFLRVHRSAIVNLDRICEIRREKAETLLILKDGIRIPVSRRRRAQVTTLLKTAKP